MLIIAPIPTPSTRRCPGLKPLDLSIWPARPTPAQDVALSYATLDALAAACGERRLDGGMHFSAAVPAGEALCAGIGTEGFAYASELIRGAW